MEETTVEIKTEEKDTSGSAVGTDIAGNADDALYGARPVAPEYVLRQKTFGYKTYMCFKRAFDIIFSGLLIILLSWLYLLIAIIVKVSDGGKVFYVQTRVGKNGKTVKIAKFRSMRKDADKIENSLSKEQVDAYRKEYKLEDDPRITKLGRFLRKTSLDELPNIFSVFTGGISFVGPRPLLRCEAYEKYGKDADKLLSVKPGMVGWWAVNGRNNRTYDSGERQTLELYYVDKCSLRLDIKILLKTVICVFKRTGAS
ncbi:MAG: sugar transferase [Clostridia bacterium]|nr:sugar transferase [Clostridia bacterium]